MNYAINNHLAHVMVLWQMQRFMCYCTVFAMFHFVFDVNFEVQAPGGLYSEGQFKGGFFFCVTSLEGLYMDGLIFLFFRYFASFCSKVSGLKSKLGKVPMSVYT